MASPKKNKHNPSKQANKKEKKAAKKSQKAIKSTAKESVEKKKSSLDVFLLAACFLVGVITFVVYQGALDNDFVDWDDFAYVIDNNLVRSDNDMKSYTGTKSVLNKGINPTVSPYNTTVGDVFKRIISLNYHPLTILTMRWNNNACPECSQGISARPFILWNIILHVFNAILVLLLIYWMSKKNLLASIVVALIFALHPMHVESVAWVSERKDVLYTFFFLSGLLAYTKYLSEENKKWLTATMVLFVLSCLSKAMAVVFPLAMLLIYFWHDKSEDNWVAFKDLFKPSTFMHTLPFFGIALFFGLLAANVQGGGDFGGMLVKSSSAVAINSFDTFSVLQRFQFACYGFLQYLIKFFVPADMCTFYPYPDQPTYDASTFFKIAPFLVFAILGGAITSIKYTKSAAVGIGFYLITVILVLQFVSVGAVLMADRYTYLPYIGFAFMLIMLIQEFLPENFQKPIYGGMIAFALILIPTTQTQIETWQDSKTLWTNVIDLHKTPGGVIHQNMEQPLSIRAAFYGKESEKAKTPEERNKLIDLAFKDFEIASKLGSRRPDVYEGMGNTMGMRGNYEEALKNYSKALELNPNKGSTYFNRGVTYSLLRQHENAIKDYTKTIELAPENIGMAHVNRGISYVELNQREAAIADFQKALQYNPNQDLAQRYLKQLTGQ